MVDEESVPREFPGLSVMNEKLGFERARHLLNRCIFGARLSEIRYIQEMTADEAVEMLLKHPVDPLQPPLGVVNTDAEVPVGETWVNTKYNGSYRSQRRYSYQAWWTGRMLQSNLSLVEKMVLFWHNHFVIESDVVRNTNFNFKYNELLYTHALGNFRTLTEEMTRNVGMLVYLDGVINNAESPNENYARELFELFTIGKGPLIAPGNYTNYTEEDIRQAAKVLTGWRNNSNTDTSFFNSSRHDKSTKVFSEIYNHHTIANREAEEYKDLISMILNKRDTARSIVEKIYRWFVGYRIDATTIQQVIDPLTDLLYNTGYDIKLLLKTLLCSDHFYDEIYRGCIVKSPLEYTIGLARQLEIEVPASDNIVAQYSFWNWLFTRASLQNMTLGNPPDVAGWTAWYLAPLYNRTWINSATLPVRADVRDKLVRDGIKTKEIPVRVTMDPFKMAYLAKDPSDIHDLIVTIAGLLLPMPLTEEQMERFKDTLIPGLPDFEWTVEWNRFVNNPADQNQKKAVGTLLTSLILKITSSAEFQLI